MAGRVITMIQIQCTHADLITLQQKVRPALQPPMHNTIVSDTMPWGWHARQQRIFNRNCWVFIEQTTFFSLVFIDVRPWDLQQLDLTLWFRLISECAFMGQKQMGDGVLDFDTEFLTLARAHLTPLEFVATSHDLVCEYSQLVFAKVRQTLKQPLAVPLCQHIELELDWSLNALPLAHVLSMIAQRNCESSRTTDVAAILTPHALPANLRQVMHLSPAQLFAERFSNNRYATAQIIPFPKR